MVGPDVNATLRALSSESTVAISDTVNTPVIDKRSADTVVVTPSEGTVVIGGLISNQTTSQDRKVPLLGDVPLLGNLCKRPRRQTAKTECLIFLTSRVVQHPNDLAKLTDVERGKLELKATTLSAGQVDKLVGEP